jgi:hypothetical protein
VARWRREAEEHERAVARETARRKRQEEAAQFNAWLRRSAEDRERAYGIAKALSVKLAEEVATVLDAVRDELDDLRARLTKGELVLDELKAERSFEKALSKAHAELGSVVTLPSKRVS